MQGCRHPTSAQYTDRGSGTVTCTLCGDVMSDPQFELDPVFSRGDKASRLRALGHLRPALGSVAPRLPSARPSVEAARRGMATIARQLDVGDDMVESALGLYKLAVNLNAVTGARPVVLSAVLYVMCRRERTSHMVFDFADAIGESPYEILAYMHHICEATRTTIPVADPSCLVHRFAEQMNLGNMTRPVIICALKVLRAMHDDWIACGRRPLGVCVAALLVACYMFNIPRSPDEVCGLVRLTAGTITRRLDEFAETNTADLDNIDKYTKSDNSLPPAYRRCLEQQGDKQAEEMRELSSMYYELVSEAKVSAPSTPERCERWKRFLLLHCQMEGVQPNEANLDLENLSPQQQLQILGLPNTKPIDPEKAKASVKQEEERIIVKMERQKQGAHSQGSEGTVGDSSQPPSPLPLVELTEKCRNLMMYDKNVLDIRRDFDVALLSSNNKSQTVGLPGGANDDEREVEKSENIGSSESVLTDALYDSDRRLALPWEFIVLQDPELEDVTDLEPYLVLDNEERLRRQKVGKALYSENWNLGAARTKDEIEKIEESHGTRKRRRVPIKEHATVQDALARALRGRGASSIQISLIDDLVPGLTSAADTTVEDDWIKQMDA
uniref:Putative transcription factor n=1 Tax=Trypanosoma congolense (strain IL3000) TaxID=1068625 RepID=G0UZ42_TRYCI|nr:putative transcription factor [Trypanosoma congolense IL3000]